MIYVDYPSREGEWQNVAIFKTKVEAVAWLRETWGAQNVTDDGQMALICGDEETEDANNS